MTKPPTARTRKPVQTKTTWRQTSIPGVNVRLYRATHTRDGEKYVPANVPAIDPNYTFRESLVREIAWAAWPHDSDNPPLADNWAPCLLAGPKGSGKTSLVLQIAAHCNIPVWRVNMNVGTTVRHLKGRIGAEPGRTVFVPGVATSAMEQGGWLVLDEFSAATPHVLLSMFPVLEPQGQVLLEDAQPARYVRRHPTFRVFATDNAMGAAMESDRLGYAGTNADQNEALLDRFASFIEVPYMSARTELKTLTGIVPAIDGEVAQGLVRVANSVRASNEIESGFSLRMLIAWARRIAAGQIDRKGRQLPTPEDDSHVYDAAEAAFLRRQSSQIDRDAMTEVIRRLFVLADDEASC